MPMHPTKDIKQVIVIRKDLKMRKGKIAAQAAHASMKVFFDRKMIIPLFFGMLTIPLNSRMRSWVRGAFAKVVVYVESEEELWNLYCKAHKNKLPCAIICDSGRTEFHGKPTYTAIAIGPDYSGKVDVVTGDLPLL